MNRHIKTHTGEKPYICDFCNYSSNQITNLKRHMERKHEKTFSLVKNVQFANLQNIFRYTTCLNRHYKNVIIEFFLRQNKPTCWKYIVLIILQTAPVKLIGPQGWMYHWGCPFCPKKLQSKSNMKTHIRTHTGEKPFFCELCDYQCSQSANLKRHMKRNH